MDKKKINIVTLGCSKNLVDSERLYKQLEANGYSVVHDSNDTSAKVVVINTCGFIGDAKEESIDTILSFAHAKEKGKIRHLFVMGCLSERYKKDLQLEIPEVDEFFGVNNLEDIIKAIGGDLKTDLLGERTLTTPTHYAYLKISEGCNWGCSYCAIPLIRGKHVSVPIESLITEAKSLAAKGVRELLIIAQDTTYYGLDIYGKRMLGELLNKLSEIEGIEWIRLHYAYPTFFPSDVIDVIRDNPKVCKYLDIPFQHISDKVLKKMRRGINKEETYALINKLKTEIPDIALRTTLLVGHPGETEAEFLQLVEFVKDVKFDRLGVFPYSEEENTYAAINFDDAVSEETKQERVEAIMQLQSEIALTKNKDRVGKKMRVLIDRFEGDFYIARSQYDSPEVDQEVLIDADRDAIIGKFYDVKITDAEEFDLFAKFI
ncbi:30S ribosomal protein S12 methylthiotransferase RimO [Acetobacteroides hydrogenigenes]|uniref:Ribosomal protein uS12 methylthiotransferase RimO n=1 Tax=Acetobacteroides hydrogenigenes TaxID=979970 RepID=A0A4R2ECC5_9BACT|nr:30S ribosomal protein S12 methylthiotransferase RimO [Acetobacteroides hydrogenigenes]TCN64492.1 ribosomal protein S12 methylthiotransferase [Acetobacteroides hydrogenigenes]